MRRDVPTRGRKFRLEERLSVQLERRRGIPLAQTTVAQRRTLPFVEKLVGDARGRADRYIAAHLDDWLHHRVTAREIHRGLVARRIPTNYWSVWRSLTRMARRLNHDHQQGTTRRRLARLHDDLVQLVDHAATIRFMSAVTGINRQSLLNWLKIHAPARCPVCGSHQRPAVPHRVCQEMAA